MKTHNWNIQEIQTSSLLTSSDGHSPFSVCKLAWTTEWFSIILYQFLFPLHSFIRVQAWVNCCAKCLLHGQQIGSKTRLHPPPPNNDHFRWRQSSQNRNVQKSLNKSENAYSFAKWSKPKLIVDHNNMYHSHRHVSDNERSIRVSQNCVQPWKTIVCNIIYYWPLCYTVFLFSWHFFRNK